MKQTKKSDLFVIKDVDQRALHLKQYHVLLKEVQHSTVKVQNKLRFLAFNEEPLNDSVLSFGAIYGQFLECQSSL